MEIDNEKALIERFDSMRNKASSILHQRSRRHLDSEAFVEIRTVEKKELATIIIYIF